MNKWLVMLYKQYNFRLAERIKAYEQTKIEGVYSELRTQVEIYPLACSLSKGALYGEPFKPDKKKGGFKRKSAYEMQSSDLPNLKKERPWYKQISAVVLQQMLRQLDDAFKGFFEHGRGYPKFKRQANYKSFTYANDYKVEGNKVYLTGIGWIKFYQSRPLPDGFKTKSVTIRQKAHGWYISICLEDESVPALPSPNEVKTAVGVDLGIKKLMALSNGEIVENQRFIAKQERRHRIRQRRATRKQKCSNNQRKAYQYLAKLDNKIARQRSDWQWKTAHKLVLFDLIVFEALNIHGMIKR